MKTSKVTVTSDLTGIKAIESIPVRKPSKKNENPKTRKPLKKPLSFIFILP